MKRLLVLCAMVFGAAGFSQAGPNQGGVLAVHDTGLAYSAGWTAYENAPPLNCSVVDNEHGFGNFDDPFVWKVYALFPPFGVPRLRGIAFGESLSVNGGGGVAVIAAGLPDPVGDFEVTQGGWPTASGGGVGIVFGVTQTARATEIYWFAGYGYAGTGGEAQYFRVGPHPVQASFWVDDETPMNTDSVADYGALGFGAAGTTPCPGLDDGICCFPNGDCVISTESQCQPPNRFLSEPDPWRRICTPHSCLLPVDTGVCCRPAGQCLVATLSICVAIGGNYRGDGTSCTPNPCPQVPTETTSWGRVKNTYR